MFLFFDFFARTLNYEPGRPRDSVEERREASIGVRRVQARRRQEPGTLRRDG
jgi:hypothetical protein